MGNLYGNSVSYWKLFNIIRQKAETILRALVNQEKTEWSTAANSRLVHFA